MLLKNKLKLKQKFELVIKNELSHFLNIKNVKDVSIDIHYKNLGDNNGKLIIGYFSIIEYNGEKYRLVLKDELYRIYNEDVETENIELFTKEIIEKIIENKVLFKDITKIKPETYNNNDLLKNELYKIYHNKHLNLLQEYSKPLNDIKKISFNDKELFYDFYDNHFNNIPHSPEVLFSSENCLLLKYYNIKQNLTIKILENDKKLFQKCFEIINDINNYFKQNDTYLVFPIFNVENFAQLDDDTILYIDIDGLQNNNFLTYAIALRENEMNNDQEVIIDYIQDNIYTNITKVMLDNQNTFTDLLNVSPNLKYVNMNFNNLTIHNLLV